VPRWEQGEMWGRGGGYSRQTYFNGYYGLGDLHRERQWPYLAARFGRTTFWRCCGLLSWQWCRYPCCGGDGVRNDGHARHRADGGHARRWDGSALLVNEGAQHEGFVCLADRGYAAREERGLVGSGLAGSLRRPGGGEGCCQCAG